MDASRFVATFLRIQGSLRALLCKPITMPTPRILALSGATVDLPPRAPRQPGTVAAVERPLARLSIPVAPEVPKSPLLTLQPVLESVQALPVPVAEPAASLKRVRSLEEVRADLARLRESAKERHAQPRARRDVSFAPTDFMELQPQPQAEPAEDAETGFASTAFLDFGSAGPYLGR